MKLLKVRASGIPLFQEYCEINFLAQQRVTEDNAEKMSRIFCSGTQGFYQNNVLSVIGINASGKTTILKLITFVCRMLNNEPLNSIDCVDVLDGLAEGDRATFDTYFFAHNRETFPRSEEGAVNFLRTVITKQENKLVIVYETLKSKSLSSIGLFSGTPKNSNTYGSRIISAGWLISIPFCARARTFSLLASPLDNRRRS